MRLRPVPVANVACRAASHGVDSSPRCSQRAVPIAASLGLMRRFSGRTWLLWSFLTVDSMAFIPSGSIGLITEEEELHRVLSRISAHLEPNGTLLLELVSGADLAVSLTETKPRAVQCADGSSIAYQCNASRSTTPDTICYSGTYTKQHGTRVHRNGSRGAAATEGHPQKVSAQLAICGLKTTMVSGASELAFLALSGSTLVEARADA